jgi:hypothetical protein
MAAWRSKLVFVLIVYFAGFATAIYTLAPGSEKRAPQPGEKNLAFTAIKSDEFAKSFHTGMQKCIDFSKEAGLRAGKFLKDTLDEKEL